MFLKSNIVIDTYHSVLKGERKMKKITSILVVSTMLLSTFSAMLIFCSEAQVYPEIIQLTKDDVNSLLPDPPEHVLSWDGKSTFSVGTETN